MGESRKVDIYLPPEIIQMIYNDIELFELFKPDKGDSIMVNNKNAFMNQLLSGYFDNYKNEINAYASDISNILGQYNIKFVGKVLLSKSFCEQIIISPLFLMI